WHHHQMERSPKRVGGVMRRGAAGWIAAERNRVHLSPILRDEVNAFLLSDDCPGDLKPPRAIGRVDRPHLVDVADRARQKEAAPVKGAAVNSGRWDRVLESLDRLDR